MAVRYAALVYFRTSCERTSKIEKLQFSLMGQRHVCTFRHAQRAAYRTAISAAQILVYIRHAVRKTDDRQYNTRYHGTKEQPLQIALSTTTTLQKSLCVLLVKVKDITDIYCCSCHAEALGYDMLCQGISHFTCHCQQKNLTGFVFSAVPDI